MTLPKTSYVLNSNGQKEFVQVSVQDWDKLVSKMKKLENLLALKTKLKSAFKEIKQIQTGEKKGTSLSEFLNEI